MFLLHRERLAPISLFFPPPGREEQADWDELAGRTDDHLYIAVAVSLSTKQGTFISQQNLEIGGRHRHKESVSPVSMTSSCPPRPLRPKNGTAKTSRMWDPSSAPAHSPTQIIRPHIARKTGLLPQTRTDLSNTRPARPQETRTPPANPPLLVIRQPRTRRKAGRINNTPTPHPPPSRASESIIRQPRTRRKAGRANSCEDPVGRTTAPPSTTLHPTQTKRRDTVIHAIVVDW